MYINTKLLLEKDLTPTELVVLQLIHQNKTEDQSDLISMVISDESMEKYTERGFIEYIKGKKNQSEFEKIRLSSKGKKLLEDLQVPEVTEDDIRVADWLKEIFIQSEKEIGNFKKTKQLIAEFRAHSGIEKNCLAFLCQSFINSDSEWQYTQRLEYLFWKKDHMYNTKFDIDQSRLYQFYQKNKQIFDSKFKTLQ